jgi:hypothetical protein
VAARRGRRRACFVAALVVFGGMLAIARTHHPFRRAAGKS